MDSSHEKSFGVFKPVGHVVISFPSPDQATGARQSLSEMGIPAEDLRYYTDREMLAQIDVDMAQASPLAAIGQELNLIRAHKELAERGYHWLVVKADSDELAAQVAERVRPFGAERAQQYGHFIIVELIEHDTDLPQVAESPARGLDARSPSGTEGENADLRPAAPVR